MKQGGTRDSRDWGRRVVFSSARRRTIFALAEVFFSTEGAEGCGAGAARARRAEFLEEFDLLIGAGSTDLRVASA